MAVWYEVEKNTEGIYNFLECNWCFHDFWIDKIEYHRTEKIVEIFMKYDELKGSVILRSACRKSPAKAGLFRIYVV